MLKKMQGPEGAYWLRPKYDPKDYTFSQRRIDDIAGWRDQMSVKALLEERGGPFLGTLQQLGTIERDGKVWERFCGYSNEACVDVEVKGDGYMGEIVAVPPDEAWRIALEQDKSRKGPIVMES
jgi:hypothetical protein